MAAKCLLTKTMLNINQIIVNVVKLQVTCVFVGRIYYQFDMNLEKHDIYYKDHS